MLHLGLNMGLTLFYLDGADSDSDDPISTGVMMAESFVKATGSDKHQEERKKTGMQLILYV